MNVDYRLLIAAIYSSLVVWHGRLSGSIALTLASDGEALAKSTAGILTQSIPTSMAIFSTCNPIILGIIICILPFFTCCYSPYNK